MSIKTPHSREFVQMVFCTKDALNKVNGALSALIKFQIECSQVQERSRVKKHLNAYLKAVEEIEINANEIKILLHRL